MEKREKLHAVSIRVPNETLRSIQALATVLGTSPSEIIRDAIPVYIKVAMDSPEYIARKQEIDERVAANTAFLANYQDDSAAMERRLGFHVIKHTEPE